MLLISVGACSRAAMCMELGSRILDTCARKNGPWERNGVKKRELYISSSVETVVNISGITVGLLLHRGPAATPIQMSLITFVWVILSIIFRLLCFGVPCVYEGSFWYGIPWEFGILVTAKDVSPVSSCACFLCGFPSSNGVLFPLQEMLVMCCSLPSMHV